MYPYPIIYRKELMSNVIIQIKILDESILIKDFVGIVCLFNYTIP